MLRITPQGSPPPLAAAWGHVMSVRVRLFLFSFDFSMPPCSERPLKKHFKKPAKKTKEDTSFLLLRSLKPCFESRSKNTCSSSLQKALKRNTFKQTFNQKHSNTLFKNTFNKPLNAKNKKGDSIAPQQDTPSLAPTSAGLKTRPLLALMA